MNYKEMIESENYTELLKALEKDGCILPSDPEEKMAYLSRRIIKTDKVSVDIKKKCRDYLLEHSYIKELSEVPVTVLELVLAKNSGFRPVYPDFERLIRYDSGAIIVVLSPKPSFIGTAINTRLFPTMNTQKIAVDHKGTHLRSGDFRVKLQKGPLFIFELEESADMCRFTDLQQTDANHLFYCRIS